MVSLTKQINIILHACTFVRGVSSIIYFCGYLDSKRGKGQHIRWSIVGIIHQSNVNAMLCTSVSFLLIAQKKKKS